MNKQIYNPSSTSFSLKEKVVHIWQIDMNCISMVNQNKLRDILSNQEIERANKFRFDQDRNAFIKSTGLLRLLIQLYSKIPAAEISFTQNNFGKPEILTEQNINNLNFNLSNSQHLVCIGFILNEPIGIDVEVIKPINDYFDVANKFFSDSEIAQLKTFPEEKSLEAFYSCWTGKEAFIKYLGEGLSHPLKDFEVKIKVLNIEEIFHYSLITKNTNEFFFVELFRLNQESVGSFVLTKAPSETKYWIFNEEVYPANLFVADLLKD